MSTRLDYESEAFPKTVREYALDRRDFWFEISGLCGFRALGRPWQPEIASASEGRSSESVAANSRVLRRGKST
jgi:hypothetical protein